MADRDYYNERERARGFEESRGNYGRDRDRHTESNWGDRNRDTDDRGPISRGTDEVRSWFGDDEARRRREMDEQRERQMDPSRGRYPERGRSGEPDRAWSGGGDWRSGGDWRRESNWSPYGSGSSSGGSMSSEGYSPAGSGSVYGAGSRPEFGSAGSRSEFGGSGSRSQFGGSGSRNDFGGSSSDYGTASGGAYSGQNSWGGSMGRSSGFGESGRSGSHAGRGPRNYQRSDERIREEVNERLTDDPRIDASDIEVDVRGGEVILRGRVEERRDKRTAEEVIENLPGVKDVKNEIRVERSRGFFGGGSREGNREDSRDQNNPSRQEGSLGHTGNPQQRDDMTTLNLSGASTQPPSAAAGTGSVTGRDKADKADKK